MSHEREFQFIRFPLPWIRSMGLLAASIGGLYAEGVLSELPPPRAESPLLESRRLHPERVFIIDGANGVTLDEDFYLAPQEHVRFGAAYRPPALARIPSLLPRNSFRASDPAGLWGFSTRMGNEVGDPYLLELVDPDVENHTPYTAGFLRFPLGGAVSGTLGLEQNDHFSYATVARRGGFAGATPSELSWFGENIPPYSLLRGVIEGDAAGGRWRGDVDQGWWWNFSSLSGISYPFEGRRSRFDFDHSGGPGFTLSHHDAGHPRGHYSFSENEASARLPISWGENARLRLSAGVANRRLRADTLVKAFEEWESPWRAEWEWARQSDLTPGIQATGHLQWREGVGLAEQQITYRPAWAWDWQPRIRAYYLIPRQGYSSVDDPVESWTRNPGWHARGVTTALTYSRQIAATGFTLEAKEAREWGLPLVTGGEVPRGSFPSPHMLGNRSLTLRTEGSLIENLEYSLSAGVRRFFGTGTSHLEFQPAPFWLSLAWAKRFQSDLSLEASTTYMGSKQVRGWGEDFSIPSHWEHHVFLEQSFLEGRLRLHYGALNLFMPDLPEHPLGNPLRFRILAGAEAVF